MAQDKFETKIEDMGALDYRAYFDSNCLRVWHLNGQDRVFKIVRCNRQTSEMVSGGKREIKKQPRLELADTKGKPIPLPLLLNKTNAKTIARLYGNKPGEWAGKMITLYPSVTSVGGEDVDCIRVRNEVPRKVTKAKPAVEPKPEANGHDREPGDREPGEDDEPPVGSLTTDRQEDEHVQ